MRLILPLLVVAALGLSACGQRGPLEPPPGAPPKAEAQKTRDRGAPPRERFILDPLL